MNNRNNSLLFLPLLNFFWQKARISINNERFEEFISDVSSKELTISETAESTLVASYLDLLFARDQNNNMTYQTI